MIHILHHQTDQIVGWLPKVIEDSHKNSIKNEESFDFRVSVNESDADKITSRSRILIPGEEGDYREFIVEYIHEKTSTMEKEVKTKGSFFDIKKAKIISPQVLDAQTIQTAVGLVLSGLEWQVGIVEYSGIRKWVIEKHLNAFEAIKSIASLFECELRFRVTTDGDTITGRYVDFIKKQGLDRGKEIVFGKDLVGITRKILPERIVTGLHCLGPEKQDGTRLEVVVTNDEAFQNWNRKGNHLIELYEPESSDEDMTEERLKQLGETELKKRISAAVEYEVEAASLEHIFGYEHEIVRLGDSAKIKDEHFNPPMYLDSRVIFVDRSVFNKSKKTFKLGEVIEYKKEDIMKTWRELQDLYATKVIKSPTPPLGKPNIIWIKTGGSVEVAHTWDSILNKWIPLNGSVTWFMYADDAHGLNMSPDSTGKNYIGIAYNQTEETPSMDPTDYTWSLFRGPQGVPGPTGENGQQTYTWIKYGDDASGNGLSDNPTGKKYIGIAQNKLVQEESNYPADYTWALIQGAKGDKGNDGYTPIKGVDYFDGQDGQDGTSSYLYVRYSQNADGSSMTTDPTGAKYIGIATTATSAAPTANTSYRWSLIKGDQGLPGESGSDGRTSYLHIKYSNDGGATFTANNGETVGTWIGTYVDFNSADSTSVAAYTWNKVKGDKGETGDQGPKGEPGFKLNWVTTGSVTVDAQGRLAKKTGATAWDSQAYSVESYKGGAFFTFKVGMTNQNIMIGLNTDPDTDANYPSIDYAIYIRATGLFSFYESGTSQQGAGVSYSAGDIFTVTYDNDKVRYYHNGNLIREVTVGLDKSFFIDSSFATSSSTNDPQIYDIYFSPLGSKGDKGDKGDPGQSLYTWVKYADTDTGSGMSDSPAGKNYIGLAYNKTTPTKSSNAGDYTWSLFKGDKGVPGTNGTNGVTTYTWIKYADTVSGSGMSDSPDGKRYLGLATNKTTQTESSNAADYTWSPLYDNVQVGGKNLILDSKNGFTSTSYLLKEFTLTEDWVPGESYTFVIKGVVAAGQKFGVWQNGGTTHKGYVTEDYSEGITFVTFIASAPVSGKERKLSLYNYPNNTTSSTVDWVALYRGNVPMDWSEAPEDVKTAIDKAQTSADGKNTVFRQDSAPSTSGRKVGDLWFETDNGNKMYVWTGSWTETKLDYQALNVAKLSAISADLGNITAGSIKGVIIEVTNGDSKILLKDGYIESVYTIPGGSGIFTARLDDGELQFTYYDPNTGTTTGLIELLNAELRLQTSGRLNLDPTLDVILSPGRNSEIYGTQINLRGGNSASKATIDDTGLKINSEYVISTPNRGWIAPTLLNGVTNYGSVYEAAGYKKDAVGDVPLRGFLTGSADGKHLFTLPEGYRPSTLKVIDVWTNNSIGSGRISVNTDGKVVATTSGNWISLDGKIVHL